MKFTAWVVLSATALTSATWAAEPVPMMPVNGGGVVTTPVEKGLFQAADALRRHNPAKAVELYKDLVNAADDVQRAQARYGLALSLNHAGDDVQALKVLEGTPADASALGQHIAELRARLLLQLAMRDVTLGNFPAAQDWLNQYSKLTVQPERERYTRLSRRALGSGALTAPVPPLKVGVLVPLSGPLAATGEEIIRGLQLGLSRLPRPVAEGVVLAPFDTVGGAGHALQNALNAGVGVIAGPLLGSDMDAVAEPAAGAGVPVVAFTTDRAELREGATTLGYLPAGQARAVANWAASQGYAKVGALIPHAPYGEEVYEAFRDQAAKNTVTLAKSSFYDPQNVDLSASVRDLVGGKPISGTVPFEAVFAPAPASALPLVTSQLAYFDVDKAGIQLLGTGLWQNNELLKPSANNARGAVFAAPTKAPQVDKAFAEAFPAAGNNGAAMLGLDAAYVLGEAAAELRFNNIPLATTLARPEGFYAPGGYAKFLPAGQAERGLDVVKITADGFTVLRPALNLAPLPLPDSLTPQGGRGGWKLW